MLPGRAVQPYTDELQPDLGGSGAVAQPSHLLQLLLSAAGRRHQDVTEVGLSEWAQTVQCRSGTGAPRCYRGWSQ